MKKFKIPCNFSGKSSPVTFYIGNPSKDHNPIQFQAEWLSKERGGSVPPEIMKNLEELRDLAEKNGVPFEELCTYALEAIQTDKSLDKEKIDKAQESIENQQNK